MTSRNLITTLRASFTAEVIETFDALCFEAEENLEKWGWFNGWANHEFDTSDRLGFKVVADLEAAGIVSCETVDIAGYTPQARYKLTDLGRAVYADHA